MMDNPGIGDNHNASVFHWCYKRMGDFIPQLVDEGKQPRVMLEYSGTLLHGLRQMGLNDVFDSLKRITCDPRYRSAVEWLGLPPGATRSRLPPRCRISACMSRPGNITSRPSSAWKRCGRVRGFSPAEMALPNHPDTAYEFVKTLKDCGYQWVLVQEHTVERPENGQGPERKHLPHRLVCRNSRGEEAAIIAIIKTQGSDTKLVAQMQPYYEAKGLSRWELAGKQVPPLVTQIADGENGGVMMNEFPSKYFEVMRECSGSETPALNATEYLEHLFANGIQGRKIFPRCSRFSRSAFGTASSRAAARRSSPSDRTAEERRSAGSTWRAAVGRTTFPGCAATIAAWPDGAGSSHFYEKVLKPGIPTERSPLPQRPLPPALLADQLLPLLGPGLWTDYGREICRRLEAMRGITISVE
jgi:hypothetical protein